MSNANNYATSIPFIIILCLLALCGTCINGFAIFILLRMRRPLRNPMKFLLTMSTGQVILTVIVGTFRITYISLYTIDDSFCRLEVLWDSPNSLTIITFVTKGCIAYDRYLRFAPGHTYHEKMKGLLLYFLLSLPWLLTFLCLLFIFFDHRLMRYIVVVIILLVSVSFVSSYMKLIKTLTRQKKTMEVCKVMAYRRRRVVKSIRSCVQIMLLEVTCFVPVFITIICEIVFLASGETWVFWIEKIGIFEDVGYMGCLISCCVNPFLYFHRHCGIKRNLRNVLKRSNKVQDTQRYDKNGKRKRPRISELRNTDDIKNEARLVQPIMNRKDSSENVIYIITETLPT